MPLSFVLAWVATMGFWLASYARVGTGWHVTYGAGAVCLFYLDPDTSLPFAVEAYDRAPDHGGWWVWQHLAGGRTASDHGRAGFRLRTGSTNRNQFNGGPDEPFGVPAGGGPVLVPGERDGRAGGGGVRPGPAAAAAGRPRRLLRLRARPPRRDRPVPRVRHAADAGRPLTRPGRRARQSAP